MKEKILQFMNWAQDYMRSVSFSGEGIKYIVWYAITIVFCCLLYVSGWLYDWFVISGKPNMTEMRLFLHEIASSPWIAVIGFIAKALIDRNKNGIPDELEDKEYNEK